MLSNLAPCQVQWTKSRDTAFRRVISAPRAVEVLLSHIAPGATLNKAPWVEATRVPSYLPVDITAADASKALAHSNWIMLAIDGTPRPELLAADLAGFTSVGHLWTIIDLSAGDEYQITAGPAPALIFGELERR
jgi:hypothetical protein